MAAASSSVAAVAASEAALTASLRAADAMELVRRHGLQRLQQLRPRLVSNQMPYMYVYYSIILLFIIINRK